MFTRVLGAIYRISPRTIHCISPRTPQPGNKTSSCIGIKCGAGVMCVYTGNWIGHVHQGVHVHAQTDNVVSCNHVEPRSLCTKMCNRRIVSNACLQGWPQPWTAWSNPSNTLTYSQKCWGSVAPQNTSRKLCVLMWRLEGQLAHFSRALHSIMW